MQELEYCCECGAPTGKAGRGEGSNYYLDNLGPFCDECRHRLEEEIADNEELRRQLAEKERELITAKLHVDAARRIRAYVSFVLAGNEEEDTQLTADRFVARYEALREAGEKLANEVAGLAAFEIEVQSVISNTNWSILMTRLYDLRSALADAPEAQGEGSGSAS